MTEMMRDQGFDPEKLRVKATPEVTFEDAAYLGSAVGVMEETAKLWVALARYEALARQMPPLMHSVLLYGPPGTGKTYLCRAMIRHLLTSGEGFGVYWASSADFISRYVGGGVQRVLHLFEVMKAHKQAVLFLDDADELLRNDEEHTTNRAAREVFLKELRESRVLLVACSNYPWTLTKEFLDMTPVKILLDLPDQQARKDYVLAHTQGVLGADEATRAALADHLAAQMKDTPWRQLDFLVNDLMRAGFVKTIGQDPDSKTFIPLTREEADEVLEKIHHVDQSDYLARIRLWNK